MKQWKEIQPEEMTQNPFGLIGKEWLLITAKNGDTVNTMTASWGSMGVFWNKNTVTVVIRPQRHTKEFIDAAETFSVTVLGDAYRKELGYLGSVSGRDEPKIERAGLTTAFCEDTPYFEEGKLALICRKLYTQPLCEDGFLDKKLIPAFYPEKDYHVMYVGEILRTLTAV